MGIGLNPTWNFKLYLKINLGSTHLGEFARRENRSQESPWVPLNTN